MPAMTGRWRWPLRTPDEWDRVIQVNLSDAVSRAILQPMLDRDPGRIINISPIIGETGNIGQDNNAATKSGRFGLTMSLAQETARKGITVNSVAPGYILQRNGAGRATGDAGQGHREDPRGPARRARRGGARGGVPGRSGLDPYHLVRSTRSTAASTCELRPDGPHRPIRRCHTSRRQQREARR
jgi:NAD(P)-dependent dehydrogenase (short-subunit alcohol dehydrogenase family)